MTDLLSPTPKRPLWGDFPATTFLPNASGSGLQTPYLSIGDLASVAGTFYRCTDATLNAAAWEAVPTVASVASAAYAADQLLSVPQCVGPFYTDAPDSAAAADETDAPLYHHGVYGSAVAAHPFPAPTDGYILGLSGTLLAAVTGAGTSITLKAALNGTPTSRTVTFTQAGAETAEVSMTTLLASAVAFSQGDLLEMVYSSTTITNTPGLSGHLIVAYAPFQLAGVSE